MRTKSSSVWYLFVSLCILKNVFNVSLHPVDVNFSSYGGMVQSGDGPDVAAQADELLPVVSQSKTGHIQKARTVTSTHSTVGQHNAFGNGARTGASDRRSETGASATVPKMTPSSLDTSGRPPAEKIDHVLREFTVSPTSSDTQSDTHMDQAKDVTLSEVVASTDKTNVATEKPDQQSGLSWPFGSINSLWNSAPETTVPTTTVSSKTKGHDFRWDGSQRAASWGGAFDRYHYWGRHKQDEGGVVVYNHNFFDYDSKEDHDFGLFADYNDILEGDDYEIDRKNTAEDGRGKNEEKSGDKSGRHLGSYQGSDKARDDKKSHETIDSTLGTHENARSLEDIETKDSDFKNVNDTHVNIESISDSSGEDDVVLTSGGGPRPRIIDEANVRYVTKEVLPGTFASTEEPAERNILQTEESGYGSGDGGSGSAKEWSEWSDCSATCGYGFRERSRQCKVKSCSGIGLHDIFPAMHDQGKETIDTEIDACNKWAACNDEFLLGQLKNLADLPSCPCYYPVGLEFDNKVWDPKKMDYVSWTDASNPEEHLEVYKPSAERCIRSLLVADSGVYSAQYCCYDDWMQLITRGRGAGTPNLVSPELSYILHYKIDMLPWIICKGDWRRYNKVLPPNNQQHCAENPREFDYLKQIAEREANT